jgi:opacity protein-like surface antigen
MNKFIAASALVLVAVVPSAAAAQTSPVTFGVTAGVTLSDVNASDSSTFTKLWGAAGGIFVGRNFNPNVGLQVEALAVQRGAADDSTTADATFRLTYIDVPVLLRVGPTSTNDMHFHVFTGVVPGFRMKADVKDNTSGVSVDLKDNTKSMDLGWTIGAGAERGALSLDVRYTMGLMNINDTETGAEYKNRSAMLKIGYRFR